jgi:ligand-binding sensor domain-containing protein
LAGLLETGSGLLAAATLDQGLYLVAPGADALHFDRANGLPNEWVRSLCEDREGNLWLGVGTSGLAVLRRSNVKTVGPPDGWEGRSVLSVSVGRDDALNVGTEGAGVYRFHEGQWTHFTESSGLSNLYVWAVSEDTHGRLWAGTWGGGLFVKTGDRFERAPGTEDLTAPIPALLHRPDGGLWAGTGTGLLRLERGKLDWFGSQQGLARADVRAIVEDREGRVWFGMSGGGLGCLENGAVRQFRKTHGLSSDFVWSLRMDEDGTLWIGTSGGGLNRFKQGRFSAITTSQGLPDNVICHIADDGRGYLWMSSHRGIFHVSKSELNRCADGGVASVHCLTYGRGDGLPTLECSGGSQPSGCRTADGRLWFASSRGLVVVNPQQVKTNPLAPPVLIEKLLVDGEPIELPDGAGTLQIPAGSHQFEFHYTA